MKTQRQHTIWIGVVVLALVLLAGQPALADTETYFYDRMNRLVRAESSADITHKYVYDLAGNREQAVTGGSVTPNATVPIAPAGNIQTSTPVFTWEEGAGATQYRLQIDGPSGTVLNTWYAADLCANGLCSVTPDMTLETGEHAWWVQPWNAAGTGLWSAQMDFTVCMALPVAPAMIAPSETVTEVTPTYTWDAVPCATEYQLWVNDASENLIATWYDAASVCSGGTCAVTPAISLADGPHRWWVRAQNPVETGSWSEPMSFTVSASQGTGADPEPVTFRKSGSGSGTIQVGTQECGAGCPELQAPYAEYALLTVIPDASSHFVRLEREDGTPLDAGEFYASPGETILVIFALND